MCFLRFVICVRGGHRDYSLPAPKNLATPLPRRLSVGVEILRTAPLILNLAQGGGVRAVLHPGRLSAAKETPVSFKLGGNNKVNVLITPDV